MSDFTYLDQVKKTCQAFPEVVAFKNSSGEQITYEQLERFSNALAAYLVEHTDVYARTRPDGDDMRVIALRGHKRPYMLAVMIACMKAGFCYVPLESSLPAGRVENILAQLSDPLLIEVEEGSCDALNARNIMKAAQLIEIFCEDRPAPDSSQALKLEDPHYILFTSGSTGDPKGVVQPARTMDHIARYFAHFIPQTGEDHQVFFNKTHFSFDMSLFDMAIALPNGHTMFALDDPAEVSLAKTFEALGESGATLWISTPSYLNMCLADPSFSRALMPKLDTVVVAGETLFKSTAQKLAERFPGIRLINSYGPTETQAVTDVEITPELLASTDTLPIGTCSPYNEIQIVDPSTKETLGIDTYGEICILGATVSSGYYGRDDLTARSFTKRSDAQGNVQSAYFTGDEGMLDDAGMLWFNGRFDDQVNVNGFRVELQEIEVALDDINEVVESCVTIVDKDVMSTYLVAHVVLSKTPDKHRVVTKRLKERLKERLPHYMIPRLFKFYDELPKSVNGKIDRKQLAQVGR